VVTEIAHLWATEQLVPTRDLHRSGIGFPPGTSIKFETESLDAIRAELSTLDGKVKLSGSSPRVSRSVITPSFQRKLGLRAASLWHPSSTGKGCTVGLVFRGP
jgi:hypothetical protein